MSLDSICSHETSANHIVTPSFLLYIVRSYLSYTMYTYLSQMQVGHYSKVTNIGTYKKTPIVGDSATGGPPGSASGTNECKFGMCVIWVDTS